MTCAAGQFHSAVRLSPRIVLYRAGDSAAAANENDLCIPQIPSAAFGDGSHPTTRVCAGAIDFLCRTRRLERVLDVGTGTGILARIARLRGAKHLTATDIDPSALTAARANSKLDAVNAEIHFSDSPPDTWGSCHDLVVANILEEPLHGLAPRLIRALRPGGTLLISGFTKVQVPALRITFGRQQLNLVNEACLEEWVLLMFERAEADRVAP